jgi:Ribophorin I
MITYEDNGKYSLNVTFGMPFEDLLASNYTVSVSLPEGAHSIEVKANLESKYTVTTTKYFSFLDFFGRPTVILNMKNAYDIHNVYFQIEYHYSSSWLLLKPVILIGFFLFIFALLIVYFRVDISLSDSPSNKEKLD